MTQLALKIDVDTDRGTRIGIPNLLQLFKTLKIPATFLFSLGPDNTGRAIRRIFRPGFLKKVSRTSVVSVYGWRTLLNGTLLPGPHIGRRNAAVMQSVQTAGHEVGIHCYDHNRWQDFLASMTAAEVAAEFDKALREFARIFSTPTRTAGAAGWQANAHSLAAYDVAKLYYASDCRGTEPFFPECDGHVYKTLQIPTTLPTLDELLGDPRYPESRLTDYLLSQLHPTLPNVFTMHAEIEGMAKLTWFTEFLKTAQQRGVEFVTVETIADHYLNQPNLIPICAFVQGEVSGRSGTLAMQGEKKSSVAK